jgi:adenine-specific DNA methylase
MPDATEREIRKHIATHAKNAWTALRDAAHKVANRATFVTKWDNGQNAVAISWGARATATG